jgi:tripartite-type tricarboxylate transporter receptor subunit TctC
MRPFLQLMTVALAVIAFGAQAQTYPAKPVRMVVPYAPGGATDIVARTIALKLTDALGQQVLVENKPGAATQIGSDLVAKSAPDGYTLLMAAAPIVINPYLFKSIPFDVYRDFEPVIHTVVVPAYLIVNAALPVRNVKELIAYVKAHPGKVSFSSAGNGSALHLTGEWFKSMNGVDAVHVPYKGSAPSVADLAAGQVQYSFENLGPALPFVKGGRVRLLAEASAKRSPATPDVPTFAELGYPGFEAAAWFALLAPAGTPKDIVKRLNAEVDNILKRADVRERFTELGIVPVGGAPEQVTAHMRAEGAKWSKIIKESGATAD